MVNAIINLPYNLKKECIFQKRNVFEGYICFIFLAFVLSFGVTMLSCMAGNESEAIKKSGIRGETKLFLGENGSYLERNPHFFVDFFPTHSPFSPLSVFNTEMISS